MRLKSRSYFYYPLWLDKGITNVSDLICGNNETKTFDEMVLEFGLPKSHKRKYNSLIKSILPEWFENSGFVDI